MNQEQDPEGINRYELGMDILARIQAEIDQDRVAGQEAFYPSDPFSERSVEVTLHDDRTDKPDVKTLIDSLRPLPAFSLLIGCCEDGLPVFYELDNPQPGSVLLVGGPQCGKTSFLRSILKSASLANSARKVRFACISPEPEELDVLLTSAHCYRYATSYDNSACELISGLAEIASQRAYGRQLGAAIILVIDNLISLVDALDEETFYLLLWLLQNGPSSQIVTVATLDASKTGQIDPNLFDYFGTFLVGQIDPVYQSNIPARLQTANPDRLNAGEQFSLFFDNGWVRFWIPKA